MSEYDADDYEIDMTALLVGLGVHPGMVVGDSARVMFLDGKAIIEYQVRRAVPGVTLAMAMLAAAKKDENKKDEEQEQEGAHTD